MKIVHTCPTYFSLDSVIAGAERYSYNLAKAMAKTKAVTLVTFGPKSFVHKEGGLTIKCFKRLFYIGGDKISPLSLSYLGELISADIIHCYQLKTIVTDLAILLGWALRKKVFVTDLAGSTSLSLSHYLPLWKGITSLLLISNYSSNFYRNLPVAVQVIYGGADTDIFCPGPEAKTQHILHVGRIASFKGIHVLIEALDTHMQLDIVGESRDAMYFKKLEELSRGKKVKFYTNLSDNQLILKYRQSLLTVIPSLVDGGFTTAMESMACATPVVATKVGSLPELVEEGVTGFLVPPNDPAALREKIEYLIKNPNIAIEMGKAGRMRVENMFSWDLVVKRCLEAYSKKNEEKK
jgi:glycosyltransferase involved in cell wall biosynthesis